MSQKRTKLERNCNSVSIHKSNLAKYNVILTSSKKRNYIEQISNIIKV